MVETAIARSISHAAKTTVRTSSVRIRLSSGWAISELTAAYPSVFSSPSIIALDDRSVRIGLRSVTGTPIIVDTILISHPSVSHEMKENGTANTDILNKNLETFGAYGDNLPQTNPKGRDIMLRVR